MIPRPLRRLALGGVVLANNKAKHDTPLIGAIDLVGSLSLPAYRALSRGRRRLAGRYPEENAGFFAVCARA